jgi:hypothetical protein
MALLLRVAWGPATVVTPVAFGLFSGTGAALLWRRRAV